MGDIGDSSYQPPSVQTPGSADHSILNENYVQFPPPPQHRGSVPGASRNGSYQQPLSEAVSSAFRQNHMDPNASVSPQMYDVIIAEVVRRMQEQNVTSPSMSYARPTEDPSPRTISPSFTQDQRTISPESRRASEDAAQTRPPAAHKYASGQQTYGRATPLPDDNDRDQTPLPHLHRPFGPRRLSSSAPDTTIFEKTWKTLFTEDGLPTLRLGQFLRGVAVHLIEDYEPKNSLVVTPEKLQRFYQETRVDNEVYLWALVFDDATSYLSRLYRDISAQHHLVQEDLDKKPDTPGLTPQGFETYATMMIQAYPDLEFERFAKAVQHMPINNPDDTAERFPKELSRRLFPRESNPDVAEKLQSLIKKHCDVKANPQSPTNATFSDGEVRPYRDSRRDDQPKFGSPLKPSSSIPERPKRSSRYQATVEDASPRSSRPTSFSTEADPNSQQNSKAPSESAIEEDFEDVPTPQAEGSNKIERERQPYRGMTGGGREYHTDRSQAESVRSAMQTNAPDPRASTECQTASEPRLTRTNSITQNGTSPNTIHSQPTVRQRAPPPQVIEVPESSNRRRRSNSMYYRDQQSSTRNRLRSPSIIQANDYTHHTENDLRYAPHPSTVLGSGNGNRGFDRRYHEFETGRQRYPGDQYDAARMSAYDPKERERERDRDHERHPRQRLQPTVGYENGRPNYYADDGHYPTTMAGSIPSTTYTTTHNYPPSAYRDNRQP